MKHQSERAIDFCLASLITHFNTKHCTHIIIHHYISIIKYNPKLITLSIQLYGTKYKHTHTHTHKKKNTKKKKSRINKKQRQQLTVLRELIFDHRLLSFPSYL